MARRDRSVGGVDRLPHRGRQRLARAPGALPGRGQRGGDRGGRGDVVGQDPHHVRGVEAVGRRSSTSTPMIESRLRQVGRLVDARVLEDAAGSVRRGCGRCPRPARRSGRSRTATRRCGSACCAPPRWRCCCCCCCWSLLGGERRRAPGRRPAGRRAAGPARARVGRCCRPWPASTQVSFEPPPREEFTISSPSPSATRVRPPGSTQTRLPSLTANGRRSTWRGRITPSTYVGTVLSWTTGWAIHDARVRQHLRAQLVELGPRWPAARSRCPCRRTRRPA